jgi:hypothetical protein
MPHPVQPVEFLEQCWPVDARHAFGQCIPENALAVLCAHWQDANFSNRSGAVPLCVS